MPQFVDLDPGKYLVVVNTDIDDSVEKEVEVLMGQDVYASIPVGRFQVIFSDSQGRSQVPFLIYDYNLRTMLGRGMTSTEVRYFIVPVGEYKVRIENSPSGMDEIRPVQVGMGQTQNIHIGPPPAPAQRTNHPRSHQTSRRHLYRRRRPAAAAGPRSHRSRQSRQRRRWARQ